MSVGSEGLPRPELAEAKNSWMGQGFCTGLGTLQINPLPSEHKE